MKHGDANRSGLWSRAFVRGVSRGSVMAVLLMAARCGAPVQQTDASADAASPADAASVIDAVEHPMPDAAVDRPRDTARNDALGVVDAADDTTAIDTSDAVTLGDASDVVPVDDASDAGADAALDASDARSDAGCSRGRHACAESCVDDRATASCGTSCAPCPVAAHASASCDGVQCGLVCDAGFADCDSDASNGCETDLTQASHCGACTNVCVAPTNGSVQCIAGTCAPSCSAPARLCGASCALPTDVAACGAACQRCATRPGSFHQSATCDGTRCGLACAPGFADCDGLASNGCEADLATAAHCGACAVACSGATPVCTNDGAGGASCSNGCAAGPYTRCGMACYALDTDSANCGTCGTTCVIPAGGTNTCRAGACVASCPAATHLCGPVSTPSTTPATSVCASDMSPAHCGASCTPCNAPSNARATCDGTTCGYACSNGWGDCDRSAVNGCETNLTNNINYCGACGRVCTLPNANTVCSNGACALASCRAGYLDCNHVPSDGCEAETQSDPANCGACGIACSVANGTAACIGGACAVGGCNAGYHACGATCVSNVDPATCGVGCIPCPAPANATATCDGTSCGFACNPGYSLVRGACVPPQPPRAIAPLSTSTVTSRRPTLRWALPMGADGVRLELCLDRACTRPIATLDAPGTSLSLASVLPGDLPHGAVFWRMRPRASGVTQSPLSPTWWFFVPARSAPTDTSWGTVGDVNGDALADVIVGANNVNSALGTYGGDGRVYEYLSAPGAGPAAVATLTIAPPEGAATEFGSAAAVVGDVNGDGYADIVVGARRYGAGMSSGSTGRAYLYVGGPSGLASLPTQFIPAPGPGSFGAWAAGLGDTDRDGYADVVITAPAPSGLGRAMLYRGGPNGLTPAGELVAPPLGQWGGVVTAAGDVNADGYADAIANGEARVYLYLGTSSGLATPASAVLMPFDTLNRPSQPFFGRDLDSANDLNGDGYADVLVGNPPNWTSPFGGPAPTDPPGEAYVYFGSAGAIANMALPDVTLHGANTAGDPFGTHVSGVGDLNGDGYSDLVASDTTGSAAGEWVFLGAPTGASAVWFRATGTTAMRGGDANGDGFADLLTSDACEPYDRTTGMCGPGEAYFYAGATGALTLVRTWSGPDGALGAFGHALGLWACSARRANRSARRERECVARAARIQSELSAGSDGSGNTALDRTQRGVACRTFSVQPRDAAFGDSRCWWWAPSLQRWRLRATRRPTFTSMCLRRTTHRRAFRRGECDMDTSSSRASSNP